MKKKIALFALVATMALGTSAFASGQGIAHCVKMSKGQHVAECAQMMERGVSECATSPECPMAMAK
ncbi:hypothetical protein [Ammoniphilus sp. YIM 78166]|uniref:hypothetical protein n=1 Tax=Ammoniphilus sp. YIM 78166 TaxID=1644106 RepID=UPI00106F69CE|nr:hypothetical protein [Ammoniphilus sp. YIM 78166]